MRNGSAAGTRPSRWQRAACIVAAMTLLPLAPAASRAQESQGTDEQLTFATGTSRVLLDVVVRDKKGRPITDIRSDEIEVYEEGLLQTLEDFKWVEAAPPPQIDMGAQAPGAPDVARQLNLVTMIFDKLGVDGRKLAQKAADTFVDEGVGPNTFVSVFMISNTLGLVQSFTSDKARLKAAIAEATSGTYLSIEDAAAALAQAQLEARQLAEQAQGSGSGPPQGDLAAAAQAEAIANMIRMADQITRQQGGTTSLYPLLALMKGHQTLAGRKSVVYISEGLSVPPQLEQVFESTISTANRANVSIYAIDARGLDTASQSDSARETLESVAATMQDAMGEDNSGRRAVSKAEVKMADDVEKALRLNVEGTLADLAESTGGFLVANTNDFSKGAEQMANDLKGFYEVTYTPPPAPFDGRFREIDVKVKRSGARVSTRSGYFALPPEQASALFAYEVPLLAAMEQEQPPRGFPVRAAAMQFAPAPSGREHELVVEVPVKGLEMALDEVAQKYSLDFSVLAVVRDKGGNVVERFSESYPLEGPLEKAEGIRSGGNIRFKRIFDLPPGEYTLEVAGRDGKKGTTSVTQEQFVVPAASSGPSMSSLTMIRRTDQVPEGVEPSGDPLEIGATRIVPNLGEPISAAETEKLSAFFITYPPRQRGPMTMTVEFWQNGQPYNVEQRPMPEPSDDGLIRAFVAYPMKYFPPADYKLEVTVSGASGKCSQSRTFSTVP